MWLKNDMRPPVLGWAAGNYMGKCSHCHNEFMGDKRASMCAPCAYKLIKRVGMKVGDKIRVTRGNPEGAVNNITELHEGAVGNITALFDDGADVIFDYTQIIRIPYEDIFNISSIRRRRGSFSLSARMVKDNPELVLQIMSRVIIVRAEMRFIEDVVDYDAMSFEFDEVMEGVRMPNYHVDIESDGIKFIKR